MQQGLFDLAIADFDEAFRLNPAIGHGIEYPSRCWAAVRGNARGPGGAGDIEQATRLLPDVADVMADLDDHRRQSSVPERARTMTLSCRNRRSSSFRKPLHHA